MKLYIMHGWTYSTEKWTPFLSMFNQNKVDYEFLKIPGLTAPLDQVWDLDNYVEWLAEKTRNQKSINLLGHSNGGRISIAFTLKYPGKVSNLILLDSAGIYHDDILLQLKRTIFGNLAKSKQLVNSDLLRRIFYKIVREYDYNKATPVMKRVLQNLVSSDKRNPIEKIKTQTTIIWGESDNITPLSDGQIIKQKIEDSKLFVIKNAGHSPQFTNPKEVFEIVKEAL